MVARVGRLSGPVFSALHFQFQLGSSHSTRPSARSAWILITATKSWPAPRLVFIFHTTAVLIGQARVLPIASARCARTSPVWSLVTLAELPASSPLSACAGLLLPCNSISVKTVLTEFTKAPCLPVVVPPTLPRSPATPTAL